MLSYESTSAAKNASFFRCGVVITDGYRTGSNPLLEGLSLAVDAELDALLNASASPHAPKRSERSACIADSTV